MKKFNYIKNNDEEALKYLSNIENSFNDLDKLDIRKYNNKDTAIIYIDVIEGFVNDGALASPRAKKIIKPLKKLMKKTRKANHVYLADMHTEDSVEFENKNYPKHCLKDTSETYLIKELYENKADGLLIPKNSINGFLAPGFSRWLLENKNITNFLIVGLVTDICVMNFALTLKAYFNEWNVKSNLVVPVNAVETFDLEATNHQGDIMNLFALYNMQMNDIKLTQI